MKAFEYFCELNKIPRGSYNEAKVAKYICEFAKKNDLKYEIDEKNNVKVFKNNNSNKTIMLQAHLDMVCEKLPNINFDFEINGINTCIKDDFIFANGTTLGADDGFGISLILEMLENCGDGYPNLEAVFTTMEEVGMFGAKALDCSNLKSQYMLGLDGTESNKAIIGSAGGYRLIFDKNYKLVKNENNFNYKLVIGGLCGGHSGEDINKNRANACIIGFNLLKQLNNSGTINITKINAGGKDNAIPRDFECEFSTNLEEELNGLLQDFKQKFSTDYPNENIEINITKQTNSDFDVLNSKDTSSLIEYFCNFKNGVLKLSSDGKSVIASINIGIITLNNGDLSIISLLRFNESELKEKYYKEFKDYNAKYGFDFKLLNETPFFEPSNDNMFLQVCKQSYLECGFVDFMFEQTHGGLEGGVFKSKMPNLQIVVLGADLYDIHTPSERMKISSLDKLSIWIKQIMKNIIKI